MAVMANLVLEVVGRQLTWARSPTGPPTWKEEWVMLWAAQAAGGGGASRGTVRKVQGDACWPTGLDARQEMAPN